MQEHVAQYFSIPSSAPHLEEALTHPSFANESRSGQHYQRLEFLGDAILDLCCSELLWRRYPDAEEGELSRRRAQLVNTEALADFARANGVPDGLHLGKGAEANGLRESSNVLADVVEALIAVAYVDVGLPAAQQICERVVEAGLRRIEAGDAEDPKTALQERVQSLGLPAPTYNIVDSGGPAHERWFEAAAEVAGRPLARGKGRSKRLAEAVAAQAALRLELKAEHFGPEVGGEGTRGAKP